jgi:16S rRNA U516 pseudouridylate synthase RsuA-like enzyme
MVRMQVQLTEDQARALKTMAAEQGVSVAELIRRGVDLQLKARVVVGRDHLQRLKERIHASHSGIADLAEGHDRHLAEAYDPDGHLR